MAGEQAQLPRVQEKEGPIKYKDVFEMSGEMGELPISPKDAAAMQSAENRAFGKTIKGGPASVMLSAAALNVEAGHVAPETGVSADKGLVEGNQWHEALSMESARLGSESLAREGDAAAGITIGEALEAAAAACGDKPVDRADAAAIQAAEMIATDVDAAVGSGLGAEAQASATINARMIYDEDKTKLSEIIGGAVNMLTDDKPATRRDAERVTAAEFRGDAEGVIGVGALRHRAVKHSTNPGGVAEAVDAAARINQPDDQ